MWEEILKDTQARIFAALYEYSEEEAHKEAWRQVFEEMTYILTKLNKQVTMTTLEEAVAILTALTDDEQWFVQSQFM